MINTTKLIADIYDDYLKQEAGVPKREHLGASALGDKCGRHVYYEFRWYDTGIKEGRILRLFNTGKREEARVVENLRALGFILDIETPDGRQIQCRDSSGHIGGSVDGIIHHIPVQYGLIDAEKCILEIKTHSEKNFRKFKDAKVQTVFPKHYTQVQVYMGMMEIPYTLYVAVNKNTDELYFELIPYVQAEHERVHEIAKEVILAKEPLPRIRENPSWFECKMCKFYDVCHQQVVPKKNCRTCIYSRPIKDGKWACDLQKIEIDYEMQMKGCDEYKLNS